MIFVLIKFSLADFFLIDQNKTILQIDYIKKYIKKYINLKLVFTFCYFN